MIPKKKRAEVLLDDQNSSSTSDNCQCGCIKCATEIKRLQKELEELNALAQRLMAKLSSNTSLMNTSIEENRSTPIKKTKTSKGCSCKGRCLKLCGCHKNKIGCGTHCKCNKDKCENQKEDVNNKTLEQQVAPVVTKSTHDSENLQPDVILNPEEDEDFHPMKPRRQLPRSPIPNTISNVLMMSRSPLLDVSNVNKSALESTLSQDADDIPEDMKQPIVDWQKHQAELQSCPKCYRKFFPNRLQKHILTCKKI